MPNWYIRAQAAGTPEIVSWTLAIPDAAVPAASGSPTPAEVSTAIETNSVAGFYFGGLHVLYASTENPA